MHALRTPHEQWLFRLAVAFSSHAAAARLSSVRRRHLIMAAVAPPVAGIVPKAVDPKDLVHNDKESADYRDYSQTNSKFYDRVSEFYHKNHKCVVAWLHACAAPAPFLGTCLSFSRTQVPDRRV